MSLQISLDVLFIDNSTFSLLEIPKYSDRQVWANHVVQIGLKQTDHGLHCLPFHLHFLDALWYGKTTVKIATFLMSEFFYFMVFKFVFIS